MMASGTTSYFSPSPSVALTKVLLIEDDDTIAELITLNLKESNYSVIPLNNGHDALKMIQDRHLGWQRELFDLIILDIMLPHLSGLDIIRFLRANGDTTPILIISAKGSETDRVIGLEIGADDYLTKPFSLKEFTARCQALLRRQKLNGVKSTKCLQYNELCLYPDECRVTLRDQEVQLSPKAYSILELMMTYPQRVWSREQLIDRVWEIGYLGDLKTVDVHIRWIRQQIEDDPSNPQYLKTVRGFGYCFG